jgi:putative NADH-flavin reductase
VIIMRLTIFGATGRTGTYLVEQALTAGFDVTAVARDPKRLAAPPHPRLHIVTADVMDPVAMVPIVDGADAVVSALGPNGRGSTSVSAQSTRSIVEAMEKCGARRLVTITGSIVDDTGNGLVMRRLIKPFARRTFLREVCADMRSAEDALHASDLDWTIVRPPRLTAKPPAGTYRTALGTNVPRGLTISRADLAASVLRLLDDPATVRRHVFVAS